MRQMARWLRTRFAETLFSIGSLALACGGSIESKTDRPVDPNAPSSNGGRSSSTSGGTTGNGPGTARPEPCEGEASCRDGYLRMPFCAPGAHCETFTVCGTTVVCQLDESQCDGYPACDPGHTKVNSASECLQDDAACYSRTACGITIWCTGPLAVDAGPPAPMP